MNDVTDQLRDAFQVAAETVRPDSIRQNVLPAAVDRTHSTRRSGMFMPLAAAAAVVVTISAAIAVPRLVTQPSGAAPTPKATVSPRFGSTTPPSTVAPTPTATAGPSLDSTTPPFIVVNRADRLEVGSAKTGHILGTVNTPAKNGVWNVVAATGNPRKFVVGFEPIPPGTSCADSQIYTLLYTLTLSASGAPDGLKPYRVPKIHDNLGGGTYTGALLAVSADGSTIAYVTSTCADRYSNPDSLDTISVIRDGTLRTWTISWFANPVSLSLSADGSELGYVALTQRTPASSLGSAWVLPTDAASGDATSRGHKVFTDVTKGGIQAQSEALSSDGKTMYIATANRYILSATHINEWTTGGLYAYSTATGARLRTLHSWENLDITAPSSLTTGGDRALIWDMHDGGVDEVSLVTGAAGTFAQVRYGFFDQLTGIAW